MIETIYIEENILRHPRVIAIVARFPQARTITCGRYSEVFNPKAQNFRLQKLKPALILSEKYKNFALEAPCTIAQTVYCVIFLKPSFFHAHDKTDSPGDRIQFGHRPRSLPKPVAAGASCDWCVERLPEVYPANGKL